MTTCPACTRPIEPIAQIRTYHSGCDPQGRVEMLEKALRRCNEAATEAGNDKRHTPGERAGARMIGAIIRKEMADLEFRPAQMKGRE